MAYVSSSEVGIRELADKAQDIEHDRLVLARKMSRSKRAMNPNNFNADGTCKKNARRWKKSKRYIKSMLKLKELYRKQRVIRKQQHEMLANHLISLGDCFYVEDMNFHKLQSRTKQKKKEPGKKSKRTRRFGIQVTNRAPGMFLRILDQKLGYLGRSLIRIDTVHAKASQFCHTAQRYVKKKLSCRWNIIEGRKVQRDMYSAFLIMNINDDLKTFDLTKCNSRYQSFLRLHDKEVTRLKGRKNLSCVGIK